MTQLENICATYRRIIAQSAHALRRAQQYIFYISLLRLAFFVAAAAILLWRPTLWWLAVCCVVLFLWLVTVHNRWFLRRERLKKKLEMNEQELAAMDYDLSGIDGGEEFIDPAHLYAYDLDVFGPRSLFRYINRTSTPAGKACLAAWMGRHLEEKEAIERRQEAVQELSPLLEFRQHIRLAGLLHTGLPTDTTQIAAWAELPIRYRKQAVMRLLPFAVGGINLLCIGSAVAGLLPATVAGGVFSCFIVLSSLLSGGITRLQAAYSKKLRLLTAYAVQLQLIEQQELHSPELQRLKGQLEQEGGASASQAVHRLAKLMDGLDRRGNLLVGLTLNGLFFWELWQVMRIEQWKVQHAPHLLRWIETVAEVDAYCSLATFAYNHPDYTFPAISTAPFLFRAKGMGHPLMNPTRCVRNDIEMGSRPFFIIVTGANMAGKSTYLRTVGVNFLLACIGAPVWAEQMEVCPARLVTSLRTTDSLSDNESYFFAELKRIKLIIDKLEGGEQLFIILDEILKGTNSVDKQKGSLALVRQFVQLHTNGIIATHDLQLGTLTQAFPEHIRNHCFEADIHQDSLSFSYRMRPGVAHNMNACFLMKQMGIAIPDEEEMPTSLQ